MSTRSTPEPSAPPAVVISATHSGAGKTTVTAVLLRALRRRGLRVRAFKIGPDFIDPGYHAEITGQPSINLDLWMMGARDLRRSFRRWSEGADLCVIEAMGALYDGADGTERGSAAHVAKLLGVPVVVVLDVWGMTRTAGAILDGLRAFDTDVDIAGCVLNRVGSAKHAEMVTAALPPRLRRLVVGSVEHGAGLAIPERHLGLVTIEENATDAAAREEAQIAAARMLDVDRLTELATPATAAGTAAPGSAAPRRRTPKARLAVARDAAFCFYYEENLLLLRDAGFELVEFSPLADPALPAGTDAVCLGGGYPESFAAELAANASLAAELRHRAESGMPILAECGGFIYLGRSLTGVDGTRHRLSGVLPLDFTMDPTHLAIGYVEVGTRVDSPLGSAGTRARGQEFHQSRIVAAELEPELFDLTTSAGERRRDGYLLGNVVASYLHLRLTGRIATALLASAVAARES